MTQPTRTRRRWFRFSLRTLLVVVLLLSVPMGWFAVKLRQAEKQRKAVEAICQVGGEVIYDYQLPGRELPIPAWLRDLIGEDFFSDVAVVNLSTEVVGDKMIDDHLKTLPSLEGVGLFSTRVTDAGIAHLKGLTNLKNLNLYNTPVTDAGVEHLKGLMRLEQLDLSSTQVTDKGLIHLEGLDRLKLLVLDDIHVTEGGISKLQKALPKCEILWEPKSNPNESKDP